MAFNRENGLVFGFWFCFERTFKTTYQTLPAVLFFIIAIILPITAHSYTYTKDLYDFINLEIRAIASSDIIINSLNEMNEQHEGLSKLTLVGFNNNWHSELQKNSRSLINRIMENDVSKFLIKRLEASHGVYTQITIIDKKGLNIGQAHLSRDYWNAGKSIWENTFVAKSYTPYVSEVYFSDETNKFQVDVSFVIISGRKPIGVIFAGIDVEQLEDWKKLNKNMLNLK